MTGEEELYIIQQDGLKPAEQITRGGAAMRYQPEWSPDGKRIAFSDKDGKLYVVTLADRRVSEIADAPHGQIRDYTWSPRGNYLAFSYDDNPNRFSAVRIWNPADGKVSKVTDDMFNATSPAWDPQGNYLYFLADREFQPQISQIEFNYATNRTSYIYALALRRDVKHPFPPESDEVTVTKPDEAPKPKGAQPSEEPKPPAKDINKELKEPTKEPAKEPSPEASPTPAAAESKPTQTTCNYDHRLMALSAGRRAYLSAPITTAAYRQDRHLIMGWVGVLLWRAGIVLRCSRSLRSGSRKETTLRKTFAATLSEDGSSFGARDQATNLYDATPQETTQPVATTGLWDRVPAEEWNQFSMKCGGVI